MSVSLKATAYSTKENELFQKHSKAVRFCIENELSFPVETHEFFKGKINGDNLEDYNSDAILKYIENGVSVVMPFRCYRGSEVHIKVSEIPENVSLIIVELS